MRNDVEVYTTNKTDDYLTMARIMSDAWAKFRKDKVWGQGMTGMQEIHMRESFQEGFTQGFCFRFKGEE
jgi:hypothetical protein